MASRQPVPPVRLKPFLLVPVVVLGLVTAPAGPAVADPVCPGDDKSTCGGRTFPEPSESDTALTYGETVLGLQSLAAEFPDLVALEVIGQSFDGNDLLSVELTDEAASTPLADREVVLVSQSIHGNEPGGREGGVRWLEDVLRDDDHPSRPLLDRVRVVQVFLNPDGWIAGDGEIPPGETAVTSGGQWRRGNGNGTGTGDIGGVDLNRQYPWRGFIPDGREPVSEPESEAMVDEVRRRLGLGEDIVAATDIHGEVPQAAATILLSSGQFDLDDSLTQLLQGRAVDDAVTAAVGNDQQLMMAESSDAYVAPAIVMASSEFLGGLSGSGFLGDWISQAEGGDANSTSTIELFTDDDGPGTSAQNADLELIQLYRDTVAAIMDGLVAQAVVDHVPSVTLAADVGYVRDPATTTDPVLDEPRTPMRFFDELDPFLDRPLRVIDPDRVASSLDGLGALVVTSALLETDTVAIDALRDFTAQGGRLVLTDAAVNLVDELDEDLDAGDVAVDESTIAAIDFSVGGDHPLLDDVRDNALILTEPATLGYQVTGAGDTPSWRVASEAFATAGGTTVGTTADATSVGVLPLGDGSITTVGTLLPPPTAANRIEFGLNDFGVVDAGYQLLLNAVGGRVSVDEVERTSGDGPDVDPDPTDPDPTDPVGDAVTVERAAGGTRIETAVELSRRTRDAADTVVLARADDFPDALAGSVLAHELDAPVLLTATTGLDAATANELDRLGADEVVVLGGPQAISPAVVDELEDRGFRTRRLDGADRFATARAIAEAVVDDDGPASGAVVVRADDFPDALAASDVAATTGRPIVLTTSDTLHPTAGALLDELVADDAEVIVAGGPVAVADQVIRDVEARGFAPRRVAGADRYATAAALLDEGVRRADRELDPLLLASGADFPDALTAGPAAAALGGSLALVAPDDLDDSPATRQLLATRRDELGLVLLVGGPDAVSERVRDDVEEVVSSRRR